MNDWLDPNIDITIISEQTLTTMNDTRKIERNIAIEKRDFSIVNVAVKLKLEALPENSGESPDLASIALDDCSLLTIFDAIEEVVRDVFEDEADRQWLAGNTDAEESIDD